jgi:hypothetical protein
MEARYFLKVRSRTTKRNIKNSAWGKYPGQLMAVKVLMVKGEVKDWAIPISW